MKCIEITFEVKKGQESTRLITDTGFRRCMIKNQ